MARAAEAAKAIHGAKVRKPRVTVPAVEDMDDETFIKHLELRHPEDLKLKFPKPKDGSPRRLDTRIAFEALHGYRHRVRDDFDHEHRPPIERPKAKEY